MIGQALIRTALIPGDPGYFTSFEYQTGYQPGWKHTKAPQSDHSCAPDTTTERNDWVAGYTKGCHDAQAD